MNLNNDNNNNENLNGTENAPENLEYLNAFKDEQPQQEQQYAQEQPVQEQYDNDYYVQQQYVEPEIDSFRTTRFVKSEGFDTHTEPLSKKELKEVDKRNKEMRKQYHVSNFQILKNFKSYNDREKEHYRYLFGKRIAQTVWPFFHYVILIGLAFIIMYPIMFMAVNALRPQEETQDPSSMWIPKEIRIENFSETFDAITSAYPGIIGNTFLINVGCSVVQVLTCAVTGYGFARFKFKGRNLLFGIVILQMIVPIQIIMLPMYQQFRDIDFFGIIAAIRGESLNLINNPLSLFIMAFFVNGIRAGLFILLFRQFFRGLPKELEDAAYLDGCGPFATFARIMVPNALVSFLTVFIFSVVWYWNDSYISGMLLKQSPTISFAIEGLYRTMAVYLRGTADNALAEHFIVWVQAGCLIAIAPILIMYIFLQKYFVEGVERSGIVG